MAGTVQAATAASTMYPGVGKSGSPAPKPITGRPAALRALALASTARVADSAMLPIRREIRDREEAADGDEDEGLTQPSCHRRRPTRGTYCGRWWTLDGCAGFDLGSVRCVHSRTGGCELPC